MERRCQPRDLAESRDSVRDHHVRLENVENASFQHPTVLVAVQIDLKKHGARLEEFWDGLISESRRKEKGIPVQKIKADLIESGRMRE